MRAKTRLQHKVVTANGRLLPQTKKQELWAFRQCISHYAYRTKNGGTTCMDCGYQWNESNKKVCRCPHCGARLEILDTKCRTFKDKAYYSTLATQDGLQVQRVFLMNANFRKGKKAEYYSMEIARYWVDDNGKTEITALKRTLGHYADTFVLDGCLELRRDNYVYRRIADCKVYPYYSATPKLRRNGLQGSLADIEPTRLIEALLTDSRAETMFKAGRKTCGKDIHNAHYVCPLDLKAEHDRYQERARIIQEREEREKQRKKAKENEERFKELKSKFFGLSFTDGLIVVSVLESVDDYYKEGNALHHCVGQCEYYLKPQSLVFSVRIENQRIETIELSLETFKVLQSRGLCNKATEYHDRIIRLASSISKKQFFH